MKKFKKEQKQRNDTKEGKETQPVTIIERYRLIGRDAPASAEN